jgi:homoserine acetyltransferase
MLQTWQNGDVSQQEPYNGDFEKAMASIKAKTLVLPGKTDLYFPYAGLAPFQFGQTDCFIRLGRRTRSMKLLV